VSAGAGNGKASKHILVVNDTEEIIELFRAVIEEMGHRVSATSFAPEDLHEVKKADPDLVILDLVFEGERTGWQLAQKLRMTRDTEHIPIIICTAATEDVREQEGWLVANAIKVVLKPFTIDDLELAVNKALALPEFSARATTSGGDGDGHASGPSLEHAH
jgi:CheY-like chemotaxis protein